MSDMMKSELKKLLWGKAVPNNRYGFSFAYIIMVGLRI